MTVLTPAFIASRALAVAHDFLAARPPASLSWSWRTAIFLHGAVTLGAAAGDAELLAQVRAFFEGPRHSRVSIHRSDAAACALPALSLYEATGERTGLYLVDRALAYLEAAPASSVGAVYHLGDELWAAPLPDSVWADSLMMVGPLLARAAVVREDPALRARAWTTLRAFCIHLADPRVGLFRHADVPRLCLSFPTRGAFWLRGNGWMLAAAAEMCAALQPNDEELSLVVPALTLAVRALAACARHDGSWPNMLGSRDGAAFAAPRAKIESSGTALVAAGMLGLARLGLVAPRFRDVGLAAASAATMSVVRDSRGRMVLGNAKGPTNAGPSFLYALVPDAPNADYGVGGLMLAAAAALTSSASQASARPSEQASRPTSAA